MDSTTIKIYSKMFSSNSKKLPSFEKIDTTFLVVNRDVELFLKDLITESSIDIEELEINEFLKLFRKASYEIANKFISDAINFYFSHPEVLASIQDGRVTLFPNQRSLPEIDYNLLIPVFEKD